MARPTALRSGSLHGTACIVSSAVLLLVFAAPLACALSPRGAAAATGTFRCDATVQLEWLTPRVVRLQHSPTGVFESRPSQAFPFRNASTDSLQIALVNTTQWCNLTLSTAARRTVPRNPDEEAGTRTGNSRDDRHDDSFPATFVRHVAYKKGAAKASGMQRDGGAGYFAGRVVADGVWSTGEATGNAEAKKGQEGGKKEANKEGKRPVRGKKEASQG